MFYHISENPNLSVLLPRIPQSAYVPGEDDTTKRVCVSDSIDGCITAIQPYSFPQKYYAYTPIDSNPSIYVPSIDDVYDVKFTGEVWILNNVEIKLIGAIEVQKCISRTRHKSGRRKMWVYKYQYRWIERL